MMVFRSGRDAALPRLCALCSCSFLSMYTLLVVFRSGLDAALSCLYVVFVSLV
jgi:hypothetical protein